VTFSKKGSILRKTWKEAGLGLLNLFLVVAVIVVSQLWLQKHFRSAGAAGAALLAVLCLGAYIAGSKWIERRPPIELSIRHALPELGAGMLCGLVLFSFVMVILLVCGVYHPSGWGATSQLAGGFALAVLAGIVEEILFRGLLFRLSAKLIGTWGALLFTAALFGAAHAANRGATLSSSIAIAVEAGILLGASYSATTRLWLPIGLHVGWNFTEGSLFGMTLSGNKMASSLIGDSLSGPRILTGGEFGPEASIIAVIVCFASAVYLIRRTIKLQRVEPPVWSKPAQSPKL
jgi:membrane protease YdiL (CAAX protease family)